MNDAVFPPSLIPSDGLAQTLLPDSAGSLLRRARELVSPAITLSTPQQIRLSRVTHDDHGVDTRGRGDECRSNRCADATRFGGAQSAQAFERTTDATHDVRTLERDFIGHHTLGTLENAR